MLIVSLLRGDSERIVSAVMPELFTHSHVMYTYVIVSLNIL